MTDNQEVPSGRRSGLGPNALPARYWGQRFRPFDSEDERWPDLGPQSHLPVMRVLVVRSGVRLTSEPRATMVLK